MRREPRGQSGRLPTLDGLRGIAVLLVMLYHFNVNMPRDASVEGLVTTALNAGWIGVDLFFVLSGFLITGILLDSRGSGSYFKNFYARRVLRIMPLFYLFLFLGLFVYPKLPYQPYPDFRLQNDEFWYLAFLGNLRIVQVQAFRNPFADITWSVAIEEQFYLVWPLVVALLPRKWLARVCFGALLTSFSLRTTLYFTDPAYLYSTSLLTPCRLDGLSIGALIAIAVRDDTWKEAVKRIARIAIVVVLPLLLWILYWPRIRGDLFTVNLYVPLTVWFGAALVIATFSQSTSIVGRVLCSGFLTGFGKYSYALYLFHQSIGWVVAAVLKPASLFILGSRLPALIVYWAIALALCYTAAWVSWHIYEHRFLDLKRYFETNYLRKAGAQAGSAPAAAEGLLLQGAGGDR
jgi:peptidoglycan/LPS O-acetylase OafA/YrhL